MRCSVVVPTWRIGGLDVLFHGIANQTYRDVELVLVDGIHKYRSEVVAERASQYGIRFKHVEPPNNRFPLNEYCKYANTGVAHSTGDLILMHCDYAWLDENCVKRHVEFHEKHRKCALMCGHAYTKTLPPLKEFKHCRPKLDMLTEATKDPVEFERQEGEAAEQYVAELKSGGFDHVMWSIFQRDFTPADIRDVDDLFYDVKMKTAYGPCDPHQAFLKNESFMTEDVLNTNGFNEAFDGSHGLQDTEFTYRLTWRGVQFWNDPSLTSVVLNPRYTMYFRVREPGRTNNDNYRIFGEFQEKRFPDPISPDLREWQSRLAAEHHL